MCYVIFGIAMNITANHLGKCEPSSNSTKELHWCDNG